MTGVNLTKRIRKQYKIIMELFTRYYTLISSAIGMKVLLFLINNIINNLVLVIIICYYYYFYYFIRQW